MLVVYQCAVVTYTVASILVGRGVYYVGACVLLLSFWSYYFSLDL